MAFSLFYSDLPHPRVVSTLCTCLLTNSLCHAANQTRHMGYLLVVIRLFSRDAHLISLGESNSLYRLTLLTSREAAEIYFLLTSGQVILTRHFFVLFLRRTHFCLRYYAKCLTLGINSCFFLTNLFFFRRSSSRNGT